MQAQKDTSRGFGPRWLVIDCFVGGCVSVWRSVNALAMCGVHSFKRFVSSSLFALVFYTCSYLYRHACIVLIACAVLFCSDC